jgi:hypothetical protein
VIEDENFDNSWGNWTAISVIGTQVWDRNNSFGTNGTPCAKVSGYEGQSNENDDWLISPALDFTGYVNEIISFKNAMNYQGPSLELKVSVDYDGGGDPYSANWTTLDYTMSGGGFLFVESGDISLSAFNSEAVYIAFHYTSTVDQSATWEIDDIVIAGDKVPGMFEFNDLSNLVTVYPNPSSGFVTVENSNGYFDRMIIQTVTGNIIRNAEVSIELLQLNLSDVEKGIYFISLINSVNNQTVTKKLLIN